MIKFTIHPHHNTYLHAGAADVWPASNKEPVIKITDIAALIEEARREGYDEGNEAGYEVGYEHGYSQGEDEGYSAGVADGYDEGYTDGANAVAEAEVWVRGWGRIS